MNDQEQRPAPQVATDGFSIAAFILGLLGVSLLGLIFGFIGVSRTKGAKMGGRGFAVAGLVLSSLWLVATAGLVAWVLSNSAAAPIASFATGSSDESATTGTDSAPGSDVFHVGDCWASVGERTPTPCDEPHSTQILAAYPSDGDCESAIGPVRNADTGIVIVYAEDVAGGERWCTVHGLEGDDWVGSFIDEDVEYIGDSGLGDRTE